MIPNDASKCQNSLPTCGQNSKPKPISGAQNDDFSPKSTLSQRIEHERKKVKLDENRLDNVIKFKTNTLNIGLSAVIPETTCNNALENRISPRKTSVIDSILDLNHRLGSIPIDATAFTPHRFVALDCFTRYYRSPAAQIFSHLSSTLPVYLSINIYIQNPVLHLTQHNPTCISPHLCPPYNYDVPSILHFYQHRWEVSLWRLLSHNSLTPSVLVSNTLPQFFANNYQFDSGAQGGFSRTE